MDLDELVLYVKKILPNSRSIIDIEKLEKAKAIKFAWNKRHFIVKKDLTCFELKRKSDLFITGASSLIQSALTTTSVNTKGIESVIEALEETEKSLTNTIQQAKSLTLLNTARLRLEKLIKKYG